MSDACEKCELQCARMLEDSACNAWSYALPHPLHCLLVAMLRGLQIIENISGAEAANSLQKFIALQIVESKSETEGKGENPITWQ